MSCDRSVHRQLPGSAHAWSRSALAVTTTVITFLGSVRSVGPAHAGRSSPGTAATPGGETAAPGARSVADAGTPLTGASPAVADPTPAEPPANQPPANQPPANQPPAN